MGNTKNQKEQTDGQEIKMSIAEASRPIKHKPKRRPSVQNATFNWWKVKLKSGITFYAKATGISGALIYYKRFYCKKMYSMDDVEYYRRVNVLPREWKDIIHVWKDGMKTNLPPYSEFYIQCKKHLLNEEEIEFTFEAAGNKFKVRLLDETDTEFIVKDI